MKYFLMVIGLVFMLHGHAQKKELDHTVYDTWQSVREITYQPQGLFISYSIQPQEGDGFLVIRNNQTKLEIIIERGTQPQFTEDGQFLIATIKAKFADTRQAKIDKKKTDEMPKDSLAIVQLNAFEVQKIAAVKSVQVPEKGGAYIAYLIDKKGDFTKEGSDLIVRNLSTKEEKSFNNISSYALQPYGKYVAMAQVKTKQKAAQVNLFATSDTVARSISKNFFSTTGFVWDEAGNQLGYLVEKDSSNKALQKNYTLCYFKPSLDTAIQLFDKTESRLPRNYTIGGDYKLNFSKSGNVLAFGIQPILPIKDTSLPEFERVSVDIWHYADPTLKPAQLKNVEANLKSTETVLYRPMDQSLTYLGKIRDRDLIQTNEGDGATVYATIDSTYLIASQWQGYALKDIYAIDALTGKSSLIQKAWKGNVLSASHDGSRLIYYDEILKKYYAYNATTGKTKVIAKDIPHSLYDEENDVPDDPNAYGTAKWLDNNHQFLLYDRYDIWLVDADGVQASEKLTDGRKSKLEYRFHETNPDRKTLSMGNSILLKGFHEIDKMESLAVLDLASKKITPITQVPMHFTTISAAKNTNNFAVLQESEIQSPNIYQYTLAPMQQNVQAITHTNPQQQNYNWMTTQLVKWKAYTGKTTEGVLYLPENFDPKRKYPMIVYFYERNNQTLHNYLPPAPTPSRLNIPFYASRGYVVFVPDIWYKIGYPGQSAYDYIVSGTKAMVQKGFIDSTKIALQGQSWGGYQISYVITKTNMYAAAWAGAPVVNMTSAYGGIRWGPGISRQFQYEKTQTRIGASLWERPDLYLKNSPLFSLPNVKTPLVIMSNDADDAVPWYQGIEMFTAMRRLNKKVWLLVYNNEAHNLVERRNRKDIQIREQQFFDSFLKGAPLPTWLKTGVPSIMKGRTMGLDQAPN